MLTEPSALAIAYLRHSHWESGPSGPSVTDLITAAAAVVGAVGIIWAAKQAQLAKKTWLAQATKDIWSGWNDVGDARRAADATGGPQGLRTKMEALDRTGTEFGNLLREPNYFEQLGVLVKLKGVDFKFIDEHLGPAVVERWNLWHLAIAWIREMQRAQGSVRTEQNVAYRAFEDLAARMAASHGLTLAPV